MQTVLGQERAIGTLNAALSSGRVHHAWIFSGPRGVGKFTTADELARLLLDETAAPDPDGRWRAAPAGRSSRLIDSGMHPDLHVIRKELALDAQTAQLRGRKLMSIPIDLLRERMIGGRTADDRIHDAPAYRTAMLNHGKVFIIDESELIDGLGQNTLLKTLEEPPPATYIILVTSEPDRLLPTIHSRCQHVRFARLDEAAMGRWFAQRGLALDKPERAWIETFAEGSPGEALRAAEYGFFAWQTTLAPMLAAVSQGRFPPEMGAAMAEMIEQFAQAWVKKHKSASKDAANKDGASHVFSLLAAHARRELRRAVESGEAEAAERAAAAIDLIRAAETHLDSNVNPRLAMDNLVAQWAEADAQTAMS